MNREKTKGRKEKEPAQNFIHESARHRLKTTAP